jgi:hypothetical protein
MVATPGSSAQADPVRVAFRGFLLDIVLNAIFPLVLYRLSKRYFSPSEFTALLVATTFPIGKSIFDVAKRRQIDPVSVIVLLGIGASAVALLAGGSPRLLLMRESLLTALFGLACFGSLLLPRPMMFHFGRHFMAGGDAARCRRYEASWALPGATEKSQLVVDHAARPLRIAKFSREVFVLETHANIPYHGLFSQRRD